MDAFIAIFFILVCIMLIGIILMQKGRGGGLSGAFGGAGAHSAFGSRTGDAFTWITIALVGLFLILGMVAVRSFKPNTDGALGEAPVVENPAENPLPADIENTPAATDEKADAAGKAAVTQDAAQGDDGQPAAGVDAEDNATKPQDAQ